MLPLLAFALSMFVVIDMQQRQEQQRQEQQRQRQYQQRQYQQRQERQRQERQRQEQQRQEQYQDMIISNRIMWTTVSAAAGSFACLFYLHHK